MDWLIFLPQLPASPSTLRVMVWRRMRAAGALGLQNGVWILPHTPGLKDHVEKLEGYLAEHQASSYTFVVSALNPSIEQEVVGRLQVERDEEYAEFLERCQVLIDELEKESSGEKFTFAELEETEEDLGKLERWWGKIIKRDFFEANRRQAAQDTLEACREAYRVFARQVYIRQGISQDGEVPDTVNEIQD